MTVKRAPYLSKEALQAAWLSLFKDDLKVSLKCQVRLLLNAFSLLYHALVPMAVLTVPMILLLGQLALWYQARPLRVGEESIVTVKLKGEASGELKQLAPYALNVQVKVVIKPADDVVQPTDFSRLAAMLRDAGYRGYIVLEYEERGNPREECPKFLDQMRKAFV